MLRPQLHINCDSNTVLREMGEHCIFQQFQGHSRTVKLNIMTLTPILVKWKNCVNHLRDSNNCDSIVQGGLLPGGISGKRGRQACHFSAPNPDCEMDKSDQYDPVQPEVLQSGSYKHTRAKYNLRDRLGDRTKIGIYNSINLWVLRCCFWHDACGAAVQDDNKCLRHFDTRGILTKIPNITRLIWPVFASGFGDPSSACNEHRSPICQKESVGFFT